MSGDVQSPPGGLARTDPRARDPELRGRTYAIPFDPVWEAALATAGGLPGWRVLESDDRAGVIVAEATPRFWGGVAHVRVRVGLDANAQTRVDLETHSRSRAPQLGAERRRIVRFFRALDERLAAGPGQILDASREVSFHG